MGLMDDLDNGYNKKAIVLIEKGGWCIKMIYYTPVQHRDIKQYYITHNHKGYSWPVVANLRGNSDEHRTISVRCAHCHEDVPNETLGFLELLKWETT